MATPVATHLTTTPNRACIARVFDRATNLPPQWLAAVNEPVGLGHDPGEVVARVEENVEAEHRAESLVLERVAGQHDHRRAFCQRPDRCVIWASEHQGRTG